MKNKANRDKIRNYYARNNESARLLDDNGWFERERTLELITSRIPEHSRILDVGGGTGIYSRALAALGHRVTLVDLSPDLLDEARKIAEPELEAIVCADILEFSPEQPFDVVLCFGPGYHMGSVEEFERMCHTLTTFAAPDAWLFFSFIPRLTGVAGLISRAASNPSHITDGMLPDIMRDGVFKNPVDGGFGEVYFAEPDDVRTTFEELDVRTDTLCSIRGFTAYYGAAMRTLRDEQPARYQEALALTRETASRPEVVATSWHAMYIGKTPA